MTALSGIVRPGTESDPPARPDRLPGAPDSTPNGSGRALVDAVLVVHNGARWLPDHLDALVRSTTLPDTLTIVDVASSDESPAVIAGHQAIRSAVSDLRVIRLERPVAFGEAVRRAVDTLATAGPDHWLWLLHDDGAPEPTALSRLLDAVRRSPSVSVAGPKVVSWDDPRRFVEMGQQVTRTGRSLAAPAYGEVDQGQYDHRSDTLAVGSNGMLVRRTVFDELGGFDTAFDSQGADLDFGWRAQAAGRRVVVVPQAVVRDAAASYSGERVGGSGRFRARQRRAARRVALTQCSPLAAPFLALWIVATSIGAAAALLVVKRPRAAWAEFADIGALVAPWRGLSARWRHRHTRTIRRRDLATLFVSAGAANRKALDAIADAVTPVRSRRAVAVAGAVGAVGEPTSGSPGTDPLDPLDALHHLPASLPRRIVTNPGFLAALVAIAASLVTWREAIRAGLLGATTTGVAGGELRAAATDSAGLWHAFVDSWHGSGLGSGTTTSPATAILAGLTWLVERVPYVGAGRSPASVTVAWLLLAAMPLATVSAYLVGRVATRSRWFRGLVALAWGTAGVLTSALAQGRLTVVLAHILIPPVVAGFVLCCSRTGTYTAAFATGLGGALLAAVVPATLPIMLVACLLLLLFGPGTRRLRALVVAAVTVGLLGPWVLRFIDDPRLLASGPGLITTDTAAAPPWQMLLAQPDGTGGRFVWLMAPMVLLAIVAMVRHVGQRAKVVALLGTAALALVGLTLGLAAPHVFLGSATTGPGSSAVATAWPGVGLQLYLAGLLGAVLLGSSGMRRWMGSRRIGLRRVVAVATVCVLALSVFASAALAARRGLGSVVEVGRDELPAVAVDQSAGPLSNRLLVVNPGPAVVDYRLVGVEPGDLLRDLQRGDPSGESVADPGVVPAVQALLDGPTGMAGPRDAVRQGLAAQAIGFVVVQGGSPDLIRRLDATDGLTRLGGTDGRLMWRVMPRLAGTTELPSARLTIDAANGQPVAVVGVTGPHAATDQPVSAGSAGRTLVVAEAAAWADHARVSYDGRVLAPLAADGNPRYALPTEAGQLQISLDHDQSTWRFAQGILLALVVFLAIPFGTRRSRRRG